MPLGGAVIGAVVGIVSLAVGASQKSKAMKLQQTEAARQGQQNVLLSQQQNWTNTVIGQGHDIASIINGVTTAKVQGEASVQAAQASATANQQGNVLLLIGAGVTVLSLGVLVFRKRT